MKLFCEKCSRTFAVSEPATEAKCPECGRKIKIPSPYPGPGAVIGDFFIEKHLGAGGMGEIFVARQLSLDREVALKVLLKEHTRDREYIDGLFREARAAAKLNHPNIVQAYAVGEEEGTFYFAMELVRGETFKSILSKEKIIAPERAAKVICDIARALDTAWEEQKLVHQDIKPDNIMLDANGYAKLADLGLAKTGSSEQADDDSDEVMGTPQYISPEQLTGVPTDVRSDIYSLGATFFQFVTGHFPYEADTFEKMALMHVEGNLREPKSLNPQIPGEVNNIIMKMMARDIEKRYQSPKPLIADLEAFLQRRRAVPEKSAEVPRVVIKRRDNPEQETPDGKTPVKKYLPALIAGAAVLVLISAGVLYWFLFGSGDGTAVPVPETPDSKIVEPEKIDAGTAATAAGPVSGEAGSSGAEEVEERRERVKSELELWLETVKALGLNGKSEEFLQTVDREWGQLSKKLSGHEQSLQLEILRLFAERDEQRISAARTELLTKHRQDVLDHQTDLERRRQSMQEEEQRRREVDAKARQLQQAETDRKKKLAEQTAQDERRVLAGRLKQLDDLAVAMGKDFFKALQDGDENAFNLAVKQCDLTFTELKKTATGIETETKILQKYEAYRAALKSQLAVWLPLEQKILSTLSAEDRIRLKKRYWLVSMKPGILICKDDDGAKVSVRYAELENKDKKKIVGNIAGHFYRDAGNAKGIKEKNNDLIAFYLSVFNFEIPDSKAADKDPFWTAYREWLEKALKEFN